MPQSVYVPQGSRNEQVLIEDLILESIHIWGQEFMYIPRTLVSKDEILGEDRLSKFTSAFPIEMYLESVEGFEGQGAFIQKFGLAMEQTATLTVARRRWEQLVGRYGATIIPTRPNEGDLIYFPLTKGLFEIKFVQHQDPFYQLGKLYVYKLQVELFQYSSERIDTGDENIDVFETLKSQTTNITRTKYGRVTSVTVTNGGTGYTSAPTVVFTSSTGVTVATATATVTDGAVTSVSVTNGGQGYTTAPVVSFVGGGGSDATATASVSWNIDGPESYGDNNTFQSEADDILFSESNPFGDAP